MRRPYERSLVGRVALAAALAVAAGGLVVGAGTVRAHMSGGVKRVSAEEKPDQLSRTPLVAPPPSADPSRRQPHRKVTVRPTPGFHPHYRGAPSGRKHKGKPRHHAPLFAGVSDVLLKNVATGMCADLPDFGKGSEDGPVNQYPCTMGDGDNQTWSLNAIDGPKGPAGQRPFLIRNIKDNLCMDLHDYAGASSGSDIEEFDCAPTTGDNQLWYLSPSGSGHRIHNLASNGLCLGVSGGAGAGQDARLEIHQCGSAETWVWVSG